MLLYPRPDTPRRGYNNFNDLTEGMIEIKTTCNFFIRKENKEENNLLKLHLV